MNSRNRRRLRSIRRGMMTNFYAVHLWLLALAYAAGHEVDLELQVFWPTDYESTPKA